MLGHPATARRPPEPGGALISEIGLLAPEPAAQLLPAQAPPGWGNLPDPQEIDRLAGIGGVDRSRGFRIKRGIDVVGAALGILVLSPLLVLVAVAIFLVDGRPILFSQQRAGRHGKPFRILKFRTMHRDADLLRAGLRARNEVNGAAFKMTDDPRVTSLGRRLRKTSLDELPQLWNVLWGDMSLVGPRPHPFDDLEGYADWHFGRLAMRPGITGLWQISARRDTEFNRWVSQDLEYIRGWSIRRDLQILARTLPAVVRADGR